jgi:glycosyltransferase involved in cell wall biosynthesis
VTELELRSTQSRIEIEPGSTIDTRAPSVRARAAKIVAAPPAERVRTSAAQGLRRLAMLGNHLPRRCGIATFTSDLGEALAARAPEVDTFVVAMNDPAPGHDYPQRVRFEIDEGDFGGYRRAASYLNASGVDVLSVQHEFGIFGGAAGEYVLELMREAQMPIVTTLHTIRAEPSEPQRRVMDEIARLSERLVVMSAHGARLLRDVYRVPSDKIDRIPHGIAALPPDGDAKARLGLLDRPVLFTFGLLSPDKGIEHVIEALPEILSRHPNAIYLVVGATHPHVRRHHGEAYRESLQERARRLGVAAHVRFEDRFVTREELSQYLSATDVYVTPYLNLEQITSGTLAYAVGNGRAVISTPYRYAQEMLADGRGILVPRADAGASPREVFGLLAGPSREGLKRARAGSFGGAWVLPGGAGG